MNDLISRSALLDEFDWLNRACANDGANEAAAALVKLVEKAPVVDAEVVRHGRWIPQDNTRTKFMCSDCKSRNHDGSGKYCSQCGCRMDGDKNGE